MFLGVDIGSSSTKAAIVNGDKKIMAISVVNLGTGTNGLNCALNNALRDAKIKSDDLKYTVATGYGRLNCDMADRQITEITCHAKGVKELVGGAKTVIDIGGQDAKVITLDSNGSVSNFIMNEKCAAGTGRFLEVMARVLGCEFDDLSGLASKSTKDIAINNVCTVFAESEVISRLASGESIENVARGAHIAIAKRITGMCNRIGCDHNIVMTGGVALNQDMVDCLSRELKDEVKVVPHCQAVGAIGAAIYAYEIYNKNNR